MDREYNKGCFTAVGNLRFPYDPSLYFIKFRDNPCRNLFIGSPYFVIKGLFTIMNPFTVSYNGTRREGGHVRLRPVSRLRWGLPP